MEGQPILPVAPTLPHAELAPRHAKLRSDAPLTTAFLATPPAAGALPLFSARDRFLRAAAPPPDPPAAVLHHAADAGAGADLVDSVDDGVVAADDVAQDVVAVVVVDAAAVVVVDAAVVVVADAAVVVVVGANDVDEHLVDADEQLGAE